MSIEFSLGAGLQPFHSTTTGIHISLSGQGGPCPPGSAQDPPGAELALYHGVSIAAAPLGTGLQVWPSQDVLLSS